MSAITCDVCGCDVPDEDDTVRLHDGESGESQRLCEPCADEHLADGRYLAEEEGRDRASREAEDRQCAAEEAWDARREEQLLRSMP